MNAASLGLIAMLVIRGGAFESALPPAPGVKEVTVAEFNLDRAPVTNAEFARFVQQHPEWQRDKVAALFADDRYLSQWSAPPEPGNGIRNQAVANVSWFAASAYCAARGARLPTWYEREYANLGRSYDLRNVVWEWVDDFAGMLVAADNRQQSDADSQRFCGSGALAMEQKDNYPTLMHMAMLSSMKARDTGAAMGFRCAADAHSGAITAARINASYPPRSIYRLDAGLDIYAGHPVLVTMFYGSCPGACPLLIDTLRATERAVPPAQRQRLRVLMISIDPQRDSVENLRDLAKTRRIDLSRWTLMHTDAATVRRIAAALDVQYRKLPDGSFNHSSVITLLSPQGEIVARSTVLAKADGKLLEALSGIP